MVFESLVVSRVLRLGISHKGLAQQATKRHFGHASQAMFASYGHMQCVAPEFLEQDPRVRTPTKFHHQANMNASVEQSALEVIAGKIQKRHARLVRLSEMPQARVG
jgi:hypothetical protein